MGRLSGFTYLETRRRFRLLGFEFDRQRKATKSGNRITRKRTTIPHHAGPIAEGTLRAILREAGISPKRFLETR